MSMENIAAVQAQAAPIPGAVPGGQQAAAGSDVFAMLLRQMLGGGEESQGWMLPGQLTQDGQEAGKTGQELAGQMLAEFLMSRQLPQEVLPSGGLATDRMMPGTALSALLGAMGQPAEQAQAIPGETAQGAGEAVWQAVMEQAQATAAGGASQGSGGQTQDGMTGQFQFMTSVSEAKKELDAAQAKDKGATGFTLEAADLQQLQRSADSGQYLPTTQVEKAGYLEQAASADILDQVSGGIKSNLNLGKDEFVVRLKPDGLGEITVRLRETDGKILLDIAASSAQVAKALGSGAAQLQAALRPYHAEVSQVVHEAPQQTAAEQGFAQDFGGHQHQQFQERHRPSWQGDAYEDTSPQEDFSAAMAPASGLDTYI